MTNMEFFGCAFIAFGPPLAMFLFTVVHDPLRIIVLIARYAHSDTHKYIMLAMMNFKFNKAVLLNFQYFLISHVHFDLYFIPVKKTFIKQT